MPETHKNPTRRIVVSLSQSCWDVLDTEKASRSLDDAGFIALVLEAYTNSTASDSPTTEEATPVEEASQEPSLEFGNPDHLVFVGRTYRETQGVLVQARLALAEYDISSTSPVFDTILDRLNGPDGLAFAQKVIGQLGVQVSSPQEDASMSEEEVVEEPLPEAPVGDVSLGEVSDHEPSLEEILESLEIPESTDDASVVKTPVPQEALVVLPEPKSVEVPTPLPELKLSEFVRPATELHPDLTDSLFEAHILKLIYSDSNMLLMYYKKGYTLEQLAESESNTIEGVSRRLEKAQKRLLILVEVKEAGMRSFFVRKGASALDVHICMSLWKHGRFTKDAAEDLGSKGLRMSVGKMRKRFDSFFKTLASSMITDPMDASIIHMLKRISDDN